MNPKNWTNEKIFHRLLTNKTCSNYWNYITILQDRPTKEVYDRCCKLLDSSEVKTQCIGIRILAQLYKHDHTRPYKQEVVNIFTSLLKSSTDFRVVESLLIAIGHNNQALSDKQLSLVLSFSNHQSSRVRQGLVFSLLTLTQTQAIDTLIRLSSDTKTSIRDWATFGLAVQIDIDNEKIREALWARVNDKDDSTRLEAIVGLAKRHDPRSKQLIVHELELGVSGLPMSESIDYFNSKELVPVLEKLLLESEKDADQSSHWTCFLKETLEEQKEKFSL